MALLALSAGGVAIVLLQLVVGTQLGMFPIPGGDVLIWDRVGDILRSGSLDIYELQSPLSSTFVYSPPWAVFWACVTWLPPVVIHLVILGAKIGALRVIGGSWRNAGIACWFPLVAFDLGSGAFNLVIAAAIVAAIERRPSFAAITGLAKLSPILAIDPRDWRRLVLIAAVALVITLPVLPLWPAWLGRLISLNGQPLGPQIPVPLTLRLVVAALLLLTRRPTARALGAAIALPAFYWASIVVLLAPLAVGLRNAAHLAAPGSPDNRVEWRRGNGTSG